MEVLADLVGEHNVLVYRDGDARGQHLAAFERSLDGGLFRAAEGERLGAFIDKFCCAYGSPVTGGSRAGDGDAATEQRLLECRCCEFRWVSDSQHAMVALGWRCSPCAHLHGTGAAIDAGMAVSPLAAMVMVLSSVK